MPATLTAFAHCAGLSSVRGAMTSPCERESGAIVGSQARFLRKRCFLDPCGCAGQRREPRIAARKQMARTTRWGNRHEPALPQLPCERLTLQQTSRGGGGSGRGLRNPKTTRLRWLGSRGCISRPPTRPHPPSMHVTTCTAVPCQLTSSLSLKGGVCVGGGVWGGGAAGSTGRQQWCCAPCRSRVGGAGGEGEGGNESATSWPSGGGPLEQQQQRGDARHSRVRASCRSQRARRRRAMCSTPAPLAHPPFHRPPLLLQHLHSSQQQSAACTPTRERHPASLGTRLAHAPSLSLLPSGHDQGCTRGAGAGSPASLPAHRWARERHRCCPGPDV